tara:strand:- start:262 stop:1023 length:762 start_codon:yes stop_codon:yes gene_type:complete
MGKLSKKLKKIGKVALAAGAAYGASKLMAGKKMSPNAKLALNKNAKNLKTRIGAPQDLAKSTKLGSNLTKDMGSKSYNNRDIKIVPTSSLKKFSLKKDGSNATRNMKSAFIGDDGSITVGNKIYKNKKVYSDAMKKKRGEKSGGGSFKNFLNKAVLGKKTQLKKAGGMTKARHGTMVKANTGRMNLLEEMGRIDSRKKPNANDRAEKRRVISELNSGAKKGKMMKYNSGGMAEVTTRGQGAILAGKKNKTYIC